MSSFSVLTVNPGTCPLDPNDIKTVHYLLLIFRYIRYFNPKKQYFMSECLLTPHSKAARSLLAADLVILSHGQVTRTILSQHPFYKLPLHANDTPPLHQQEDFDFDRLNVHQPLYTAGL
ncbi:hypothetical protein TNCV_3400551 [Trichonephila clavipes]|nr:hypothetical protein TNCV_3400551 [Trichonephila clavipes]